VALKTKLIKLHYKDTADEFTHSSKSLTMVDITMASHIIIEQHMKINIILKIVGCTATKMLDQN